MSFVDRLNTLRKVIGINNHFQREKNFSFRNCGILNYDLLRLWKEEEYC